MLTRAEFEQLVTEALDDLPLYFRERMSNVAILVEDWPAREDLQSARTPGGQMLLGLYQGIPLTQRTGGYNLVPPDTITLFQGPIEQAYRTPDHIRAGVRHTVIHKTAYV